MIKILLAAITLAGQSVIAQKIKVKKEFLTIEKNEVYEFKAIEDIFYEIASLEGFKYFKSTKPNDSSVYNADYDISRLPLSLSLQKAVIDHLIVKNLFSNNLNLKKC